jgi:hypothetical protein
MLYDDICTGLEALGGVRQPRRGKYTVYKLGPAFYLVGNEGELRQSHRAVITGSIKCNAWDRDYVLNAARTEKYSCPLTL